MDSFFWTNIKDIKVMDIDNGFKEYHISNIFIRDYKCILIGVGQERFVLMQDIVFLLSDGAMLLHTEDILSLEDIPKYRSIVDHNQSVINYMVIQNEHNLGLVTDMKINKNSEISQIIVKPRWPYRILYEDFIIKTSSIDKTDYNQRRVYVDNKIKLTSGLLYST